MEIEFSIGCEYTIGRKLFPRVKISGKRDGTVSFRISFPRKSNSNVLLSDEYSYRVKNLYSRLSGAISRLIFPPRFNI